MRELMHLLKKKTVRILLLPLCVLPIKRNRLVLNNGLSHNYSDNPKAVAECLIRKHPGEFEIIFAVDDPEQHRFLEERGIRCVRFHSPVYFYYAVTAAVYLTNNGGYSYLPRRKGQLVIETWHGGGAYKRCGLCEYRNKRIGRCEMRMAAGNLDIFLSTSKRATAIYSENFLLPHDTFWEIGMPRNDGLVHADPAAREAIRRRLGISGKDKLVLFAPTFRRPDGGYTEAPASISYGIDSARVCAALGKRFTGTWRFAFRFHPGIRDRGGLPEGSVANVSDYEDMQELLLAADVLITDFSSSMWDFMLTGRPCFLFMPDFECCEREVGFFSPPSEWPFSMARSNEELERDILDFNESGYAKSCAAHYAALGGCETGRAAQLVGKKILRWCQNRGSDCGA